MWTPPKLTLIALLLSITAVSSNTKIHNWLVSCYRGNETKPKFPDTVQLLVELIRKIENSNPSFVDIRTLSATLLHELRLDGIESVPAIRESKNVTPFGVSGIESPKFQLILRTVSNVASNLNIPQILNRSELCQLHRMLSVTVEPWERGDENKVCPMQQVSWRPDTKNNRRYGVRPMDGVTSISENIQNKYSRCPIEKGVVRSNEYGTFTPGTVIASIAAGLQRQKVYQSEFVAVNYKRMPYERLETMQIRDTERKIRKLLRTSKHRMDNTYSASLAGDLAEICVYQAPYIGLDTSIGVRGFWNDTYLPRIRYLEHAYHFPRWEMTDSEILGGIDGLYLAHKIPSFTTSTNRLKLSQVLDMYYSKRGLPFVMIENTNTGINTNTSPPNQSTKSAYTFNTESNSRFRAIFEDPETEFVQKAEKHSFLNQFSNKDGITNACHRKKILDNIDRQKLKDETFHLSQVLQLSTSSLAMSDDVLRKNCDATVERFYKYSDKLLQPLSRCEDKKFSLPKLDLSAIIVDDSRNQFEKVQLISFLIESIDVSEHGSRLSVIEGSTGKLIVNQTESVAYAFKQLDKLLIQSEHLSLSRSLASHIEMLSQQQIAHRNNRIVVGLPQVALIVAQGQLISEFDFANARRIIQQSVERFPDLHYIFLTNNPRMADDLTYGTTSYGFQQNKQYHVINEKSVEIDNFKERLLEIVNKLPKRIMATSCPATFDGHRVESDGFKDYFEDYLTPNEEHIYRISPFYLMDTDSVQIRFDGVDDGTFTICMSENEENFDNAVCQTVSNLDTVRFDVIPCNENSKHCPAVWFKLFVEKSLVQCFDNDCRYPDQVRFYIRQKGLRCDSSGASNHSHTFISIFTIFIACCSYFISEI